MSRSPRLQKAMDVREANPDQQFGTVGDEFTANGATGCTHAGLAFLALLWTGKRYSHDQISRMVGYPNQSKPQFIKGQRQPRRGLRPSEVQDFCVQAKLPYVVRFGVSADFVIKTATERGPVAFGHSYSYWPEWQGYRYGGIVADGRPNGFASPLGKGGKTQLQGFSAPRDAHFGVLLGTDQVPGHPDPKPECFAWEPNHGSVARPEKPPYDIMSDLQFRRVYDSYTHVLGRQRYALLPTRSLPL